MESFKQVLNYIKKDFEINTEDLSEINMEFIKIFHKEFNKYQEQLKDNLDFLNSEEFKSLTPVSRWFKENKDHERFLICKNNLYTLLCVAQDIMGNEMLKGIRDMNPDNMHNFVENMLGGEDSPFGELLSNSPLGELFNNPEMKQKIQTLMDKLKNIDLEGMISQINSGNFDISQITNIMSDLGLAGQPSADNPLGSAMGLLSGLMGGEPDEMAGLTPQQRAKLRREKAKAEYRRKIRAKEKERKKKRGNNRKKKRG